MNVSDLDGNNISWQLTGHIAKGRLNNKSSFHLSARKLLSETFPTLQILEEVPIPIRRSETLYLDFYLPLIKTCIEVHGEQHFKFVPFYHNSMVSFLKSRKRDEDKKTWCELNNIKHIVFSYDETKEIWKSKLDNKINE
jgi:hypothetical protein